MNAIWMRLPFLRSLLRRRLLARPFPAHWRPELCARLPWYDALPDAERRAFEYHLKLFVWEKHWEGAAGLEVTETMQLIVAASAARIARKLPLDVYDRLTEIVIYPSHYRHPDNDHAMIYGQAHGFGTVVLSWDAVEEGIAQPHDAHDTAIHEFAHVLDVEDGLFDGTPLLERGRDYRAWVQVMGRHFARLQDDPTHGVLRAYGAQNEAEFFAVATEAFFETPAKLKARAPDLYEVLRTYFNVDPG
ncbi:hypothetical protein DL240_11975 [Lujinxingia litoralis]|uniref:Zinc-dependent peptidase n=1 Tax=Lujinxingia litoralis TaxID=2211119 RepID=A0A328C7G5_9DELT|nr:M90 family metallopeptidase [Lujinxingia litoralis]RAL21568.1 hypothetical protein DL240_11975 [Lujinxingia litoralis]